MSDILNKNEFLYHINYNLQWVPLLNGLKLSDTQNILKEYKTANGTVVGIDSDVIINNPELLFKTLELCARYNFGIDFRTNCKWIQDENSDKIIARFEKFFKKFNSVHFTYSLALDEFYEKNPNIIIKFMNWYTNTPSMSHNARVYVMQNNINILVRFMMDLIEKGNILANYYPKQQRFQYIPMFQLNDTDRFFFQQERRDLNNSETSIIKNIQNASEPKNISFNSNGSVSLFNAGNTAVSVPYTRVNGTIKSIKQIKQELFGLAYQNYLGETK